MSPEHGVTNKDGSAPTTMPDGGPAPPADAGSDTSQSAARIHGTVLDSGTHRPLPGRTVTTAGGTTTTDDSGQFTASAPPGAYDLVIREPNGEGVTVYLGLTRPDPVLLHTSIWLTTATTYRALIAGSVSGGGTYPLGYHDTVMIGFFSPQADLEEVLSSGISTSVHPGPSYGPMPVGWNAPPTTSGELMALGEFDDGDGGYHPFFTEQPLTLTDAGITENLALAPIPSGRFQMTIQVPAGFYMLERPALYRFKYPNSAIAVQQYIATKMTTIDEILPDLTGLGGTLCVRATAAPGLVTTKRCGMLLGGPSVPFVLEPPPVVATPGGGSTPSLGALSWSAFPGGIYDAQLFAEVPTAATPNVDVYTANTSLGWDHVASLGVSIPIGSSYTCDIVGLGPYASVDDATGPDGLSLFTSPEQRNSVLVPPNPVAIQ